MGILLSGFFLLATTYTANKFLLEMVPISVLTTFKMLLSSACFLGILFFEKNKTDSFLQKVKEDIGLLLFVCIFTTSIPYFLKMYSLKHLTSSQSMMIGGLDPFITTMFAFFLFNEKLNIGKALGICLGMLSLFTLFYFDEKIVFQSFQAPYVLAIFSGIMAIVIGRYGWIKIQALLKANRYTISEINFIVLIGGGFASFATTLAFGLHDTFSLQSLNTTAIALLFYTAIVGNVFAYYIYSYSIKRLPITTVSYCGLIIPLSGHFLGWVFLGEALSRTFFLSIIIIFIGYRFYFSIWPKRKPA